MKNWSTDENHLKKFPEKYKVWKLEQKINYGLDVGEKINRLELVKYWRTISSRIDPHRYEFLKFLLWG
ncbi:hypothetical protein A3D78_04180 [Candidatus Gottesmanbacteria bacterium RIFCSPHIGHO2_02_FULL_39_14]|uniref:Uncharacterized protein n=3 Tax=Candidatus Gottesmaniibacteriota TaxID=1752720 RepID=A0A1F5ZYE7_9BACT|nr:MAG: hypothetical protein A2153_02890 [Candidatus Gottesmanbacteria bacterium RBG_16_38_7b]OGG17383.1 MAG: hypothetical protein A3D78_04180 [Candidatus Gottesmanbacteria bacterium RIFCSPHIGHO2_02_FULL_39_14]OGG30927.1 MAG: hypothetical protein A3I51_01310 [Candidatus Gottesmanbacteria bacterium RIFCSPLOWO2_02_FULL_38_8]